MAIMYEVDGLYTIDKLNVKGRKIRTFVKSYDLALPGNKDEIQELVNELQYLLDNIESDEIDRFNDDKKKKAYEAWVRLNEGHEDNEKVIEKPKKQGYVYVIKEHFSGTYKIGKTTNIKNRLNAFGVKLPFKWDVEFVFKSNYHELLEEHLHRKFSEQRVNGEWFNLTKQDLYYLETTILEDDEIESLRIEVAECPEK